MSKTRERMAIRVELFSLTLDDKEKETGSDKGPFRVYMTDGFRLHEIYNPNTDSELFNALPEHLRNSDNIKKKRLKLSSGEFISGHTDLPSSTSLEPKCGDSISEEEFQHSVRSQGSKQKLSNDEDEKEMEYDEDEDEEEMEYDEDEEEIQDSVTSRGSKRTLINYEEEEEDESQDGGDSRSGHDTDLVLTGPNGDIVAWDYFDVIVHYETGNRETDDSHLEKSRLLYLNGLQADESDVIRSWMCHGSMYFLNRRIHIRVAGPFGCMKLDFIAFRYSRLVTVDVKWFLKDLNVEGGEDGIMNHATETSYICGKLSLCSSLFDDATCILLKTPEDKGIIVKHGKSIRLLKSKVAIPVCKFFTVQANLKDPATESTVKSHVDFFFDQFSEEENYAVSRELDGRGAKIVVKVTMLPNDMEYLESAEFFPPW